ncbi:2,5-didehydrogluconate reductase [Bifidobacterium dolichotidis]|uniref:2,5-didehydrogluconate reductase n=1 Tax=Bifidobacterium dolichotidis TaxID=2306976 RepID=A0A430FSR5_9BIFI|nr:aldo/keto reductase [Bifidobacterium dolichotidis]RSX55934.1 2,5-didehydrogluconate reductase [Bifidobacterium dolichotidis]
MQTVKTTNGVEIPQLGYGVYEMTSEEVREHLPQALQLGYRHVDTANAYFNEVAVGEAINNSGIPRDQIFLTTKIYPADYGTQETMPAIDASLKRLGTDYVDLLLLHHPYGKYVEAWPVLEQALAEGKVRSIGVSNFPIKKINEIAEVASIFPQVMQIEMNPRHNQHDFKEQLIGRGVVFEGWYPLGHGDPELLNMPVFTALAEKYGKTNAQIIERWHMQEGNVIFPKTLSVEHMKQNLDIFDFELTDDEMARIDAIPQKPYYVVPEQAPDFFMQKYDYSTQVRPFKNTLLQK